MLHHNGGNFVLQTLDPQLHYDVPKRFIKYLGISIGPGSFQHAWYDVIPDYVEASFFLCAVDVGLASTTHIYNVVGASTSSWVGSFLPPNAELLALGGKSLQRLLRCRWNVATVDMLTNLKQIDFPLEFHLLSCNSN